MPYIPPDAAHPPLSHDAYGLSKEVAECTVEMFWRREPMSVAALHFNWIVSREQQLNAIAERRGRPDAEREERNL